MQTIKVRTTQNVLIDYPLAGLFDRILALLLDVLIYVAYFILAAFIIASVSAAGGRTFLTQILLLVVYLPIFLYHLIFEIAMNGQSPGKRVMNVRVVRLDGQAPTIGNYIIRWILRPIDILLSGSVAITFILLTEKSQRLGDIAAGTTVVKLTVPGPLKSQEIIQALRQDYQPQFPQVIHLTDKDISIIKEALAVYHDLGHTRPMILLSDKIRDQCSISTDMEVLTFLNTVLKDYHYLTSAV